MEIAIRTQELARDFKSYKKGEGLYQSIRGLWARQHIIKQALVPTNLEIPRGQIVGLVGANGAGKTTLLKLLSGLIFPTSGTAHVLGFEPWRRQRPYLRRMSILLGQKNQLWWDIPPIDSYSLLTRIYDLDRAVAKKRIEELSTLLRVEDMLHVQLRRLSLGERMKMEIIGSLLHQPDVLFLDEPTIGLDIVAQTTIRSFLGQYVKVHQPTLILTSHYMDDISKLADRLLLISHGAIVYDGSVREFMGKAVTKQRLSFTMDTANAKDIPLPGDQILPAGAEMFSGEFRPEQIGSALQIALNASSINNIKIEETNFETVIHGFLESQLRSR